jgi:hypothetical protein
MACSAWGLPQFHFLSDPLPFGSAPNLLQANTPPTDACPRVSPKGSYCEWFCHRWSPGCSARLQASCGKTHSAGFQIVLDIHCQTQHSTDRHRVWNTGSRSFKWLTRKSIRCQPLGHPFRSIFATQLGQDHHHQHERQGIADPAPFASIGHLQQPGIQTVQFKDNGFFWKLIAPLVVLYSMLDLPGFRFGVGYSNHNSERSFFQPFSRLCNSPNLRNPGHADQGFRCMPISDSVSCRSVIPAMPITDSGDVDQAARR